MAGSVPLSRRSLLGAAVALAAIGCRGPLPVPRTRAPAPEGQSSAQPETSMSLVVPWAVGGPSDTLMRLAAEYLQRYLDHPVVVQNVTGSGGSIGARQVLSASPGSPILLAAHESLISAHYMGLAPFNWTDFEPVALLFSTPDAIVVRADSPWTDMHELIKDARRRPEQISWGATFGSTSHLLPAAVMYRAGVRFKLVGYEGTAERIAAVLAGDADVATHPAGLSLDDSKWAKLRMLASAGLERDPTFGTVPTLREQGIDVSFATNRGLLAPRSTSEAFLGWVEAGAERAMADPELIAHVQDEMHARVHFLGRAQYREQLIRWDAAISQVVETMGLRGS
jgi:tripartite-type tricarboxylate transporter receptor subunit TctC